MSHSSNEKLFDEYECSGPRPPVPGEESQRPKMTETHMDNLRDSPPSYLKWARTLSSLLEDREGVEIFKRYVESEGGINVDRLNFYFACEGLKQQTDPEKVKQMIGAIYRFLRKSQLSVTEDLRRQIKSGLKNEIKLTTNIYDAMQNDIERIINETTYPNFIRSDCYLQHVQSMQQQNNFFINLNDNLIGACGAGGIGTVQQQQYLQQQLQLQQQHQQQLTGSGITNINIQQSISTSTSGSCSSHEILSRSSTLPTLHEDTELNLTDDLNNLQIGVQTPAEMPLRLTRDLLLATQNRRLEVRPPGAHGYSVYTAYASYNPVSLQDSERQSLSSGRTDSDTMSMSGSSMDGRPYVQRRYNSIEARAMRQNALTNKEADMLAVIPRTQRLLTKQHLNLKPEDLVSQLVPKLEKIKRQQESQELLERKLQASDPIMPPNNDKQITTGLSLSFQTAEAKGKAIADAIREKFQLDDDNDQAILDQHVSRVWSDLTPVRSPGTISPCPLNLYQQHQQQHTSALLLQSGIGSGGGGVNLMSLANNNNNFNNNISNSNNRRKTHDNVFTSSSGFGDSFTSSICGPSTSSSSSSMRHSKSMPEHNININNNNNNNNNNNSNSGNSSSSYSGRKLLSNKWPSMNTDSGISMFSSDTLVKKDQNSRNFGGGRTAGDIVSSGFSGSVSNCGGSSVSGGGSNIGGTGGGNLSTASQLEEARRRLEDETKRSRKYSQQQQMVQQSYSSSGPSLGPLSATAAVTAAAIALTKQQQQLQQQQQQQHHHHSHHHSQEYTTVVFSFCDEEFPYRTKIPGLQPTLRQFKDYLPKKGNFRFFFKTACEDPDSPVIQEEIMNDTDILPLFEGKVMGLVKPLE